MRLTKGRLALVVALSMLTTAAADAQNLNKRKLENLVRQILEQRAGVRAASIECPVATPVGVGNRSVCTATGPEGATFTVELIQTDEEGGVNFTVADDQALAALTPPAGSFFERWKAGDLDAIYAEAHTELRDVTTAENFSQLLECTAADFGGIEAMGEPEGAAMHRGDNSGQLITAARFGAGPASVSLNFKKAGDDWLLLGVNMPILEVDHTTYTPEELVSTAARLFERIDAGDWDAAHDLFSYELRKDVPWEDVKAALDDPWDLGPVRRIEMTSYARNTNGLPWVLTKIVRESGEQRSWLVFRSCGDEWKVRVMQLMPPTAEAPVAAFSDIQREILVSAKEQGLELSLECPGSEVAVLEGLVYTCEASHSSGLTAPLEITMTEGGEYSWQLLADSSWDPLFE